METNSILSPLSYFLFQAMLQWFWPPWLGSSNRFSDLANSSRPPPSPPSSHGLWSFLICNPCLASLLAGALSSLRCTSNWIPFCSYSLLSPWVWPLDTGGQQEHGCHSHLCPQRYFRFGFRYIVIASELLPAQCSCLSWHPLSSKEPFFCTEVNFAWSLWRRPFEVDFAR